MVVLLHLQLLDHFLVHVDLFCEGSRDCCDLRLKLGNLFNMQLVLSFVKSRLLAFLLDLLVGSYLSENKVLVELFWSVSDLNERALLRGEGYLLAA